MQVLDVKQQTELDKALKEVDFEIEEELEQEKEKLMSDAQSQIEAKRKALRDKLNAATSEEEQAGLKDQLRNFDRQHDQFMADEKLK